MNVIKWLKLEWYIPQRNKAQGKVAGHRRIAKYLEEKPKEKKSSRVEATIEYNYAMAHGWQIELEKLERKISQIENE